MQPDVTERKRSRKSSKLSSIGKSIRKLSTLSRRGRTSFKRKRKAPKRTGSVLIESTHSSVDSHLTNIEEDEGEWMDVIEMKRSKLENIRENIRFNFALTNGVESLPGTPSCSMNPISSEALSTATTIQLKKSGLHAEASYSYSDSRLFSVQQGGGPTMRRKSKTQSRVALYDLVSADYFQTENKLFDISDYIDFPIPDTPSCHLPEYLVINFLIPKYKPNNPLFKQRKTDGLGVNFISIYSLSDWAKDNPNNSSVHLFRRFISACVAYRKSKNPKLREMINRLKNIMMVLNPEDLGFGRIESRLFPKYNKIPWLVRYFLTTYKLGKNYFEIDIDFHSFRYTTLQLGHMIFNKVKNSIVDCGIVIEARDNSEMPERMLCNVRFFRLDLDNAPKIVMSTLGTEITKKKPKIEIKDTEEYDYYNDKVENEIYEYVSEDKNTSNFMSSQFLILLLSSFSLVLIFSFMIFGR